ncbi:MAG: glucose-6-phosphate dehydrogenase [Deltaproteobacteria bacterium]|nr:glucose-6-phosphate dehydrogenase [Deltaproteobacteria bacterium]
MSDEPDGRPPGRTSERIGNQEPVQGEVCPTVEIPDPCALVIFGASGDLTRRKLIPALYYLYHNNFLPPAFFILGTARTLMTDDAFRETLMEGTRTAHSGVFDKEKWSAFSRHIFYHSLDYGDPDSYRALHERIEEKEREQATGRNRIFYLAVPPTLYETIAERLGEAGLARQDDGYARIIIEKPFGRDLASAQELNTHLHHYFLENQVFRIDHYLGKETVQNILIFRFMNAIFEPIWNRRYIDHVQITAVETLGVESRAGYYEGAGVLRDMFQNHMMQLLALTAMEPPTYFNAERVRDEKIKVFRSLRSFDLEKLGESLVLGQYGPGELKGKRLPGYREEKGVAADSRTPTFAAACFFVDNWRWQGVPFYLRSGKRLPRKVTEIAVQFREIPHLMLRAVTDESIAPNVLILRIQPDERIMITFQTKKPGFKSCLRPVMLDFSYKDAAGGIALDSYERVLLDGMLGDPMLFVREEGVERTWSILTPVLEVIENREKHFPLYRYPAGSSGPVEANALLEHDEDRWREL